MLKSNEKNLNKTHHTIEFLLYGKKSEDTFHTANLYCESNERLKRIKFKNLFS